MLKGDGTWETTKLIIGWLVNAIPGTIHTHQCCFCYMLNSQERKSDEDKDPTTRTWSADDVWV
eukprot:scaffold26933_cov29-Attheya_sp.AAC.2